MAMTMWTKTNGSAPYGPEEGRGIQTRQSSDPLNLKVPAVQTNIYRNFLSARCVKISC